MMKTNLLSLYDDSLIYNIYPMDLQIFADSNKTEPATQRRKEQARKKGQVLHSPEITAAVVLTVAFLSFQLFGTYIYNNILALITKVFTVYIKNNDIFDMATFSAFSIEILIIFFKIVGPIILTIVVAGLAINYAQVGVMFTTETLAFNIERIINPMNGLKRMFSIRTVAELVKSIAKIIVVGVVVFLYIKGEVNNILSLMDLETASMMKYYASLVFNVGIRICVTFIILGLFDYLFQWWQYEKNLRMSKQEIKDEYKETEGNPEVKSKIREKQRAMSMRRMMQEVPKADVVITNPTHFAVAIRYDVNVSSAPIVIAKGQDYVAQRIKEIAKENKVEIVENKPLARTLYDTVDVGESIPPELYQAVAEILAFVYSLRGKV